MKLSWMLISLFLLPAMLQAGDNYYVATDGNDAAAGTEGTPFATLEHAVAVAKDGDTILLKDGTYTRNSTAFFTIDKALEIRSVNGRGAVAIIGNGTGNRMGLVINHAEAVIRGITFRSYKTAVYTPTQPGALDLLAGTVADCAISNCTANVGSAIRISGGTLTNSIVFNNSAAWGGADRYGGGIAALGGAVRDCDIYGNRAPVGAGIAVRGANAVISDCHIFNNMGNGQILTASGLTINGYGGGVQITAGLVERCHIYNNTSYRGAGVYTEGGILRNCIITNNHAIIESAGGVYAKGTAVLENLTIVGNTAMMPVGAELRMDGGTATNLIVSHRFTLPASTNDIRIAASASVGYSALPVAIAGEGNLVFNPSNIDQATLRPFAASPCAAGVDYSVSFTDDVEGEVRPTFSMGALNPHPASEYRAIISADVVYGIAPLTVQFAASASGATAPIFSWNFGDASEAAVGTSADKTYTDPGLYTVTLSASDTVAGDTSATLQIFCGSTNAYVSTTSVNPVFPYATVATASTNIQRAVEAVYADDNFFGTVFVADGTYTDLQNASTTTFSPMVQLSRRVRLTGSATRGAIFDAAKSRQTLYLFHPDAAVDGVTLKNGRYDINNMFCSANLMLLDGVVSNCLITGGYANYGGNCSVFSGRLTRSDITAGSLIVSGPDRPAGGVNLTGDGIVEFCNVYNNQGGYGAGVYIGSSGAEAVVRQCRLFGNYGSNNGGAGATLLNGLMDSCVVVSNTSSGPGGGVYLNGSGAVLRNAVVAFNRCNGTTETGGGGVLIRSGTVQHTSIYGNTSASSTPSHGLHQQGGSVINSIIFGNGAGSGQINKTGGTLSYSCLPGSGYGVSNVVADPGFTAPYQSDFTLLPGSPCLDSGSPDIGVDMDIVGTTRPQGNGPDMGCYEMNFSGDFVCSFSADETSGFDSLTTTLRASVIGGVQPYANYKWEFNDGTFVEGSDLTTITHSFGYGSASVTLTVTDANSATATRMRYDVVKVASSVTYAAPGGGNIWPYETWERAANMLQDAVDSVYYDATTVGTVYVADGTYKAREAGELYVLSIPGAVRVLGTNSACKAVIDGERLHRGATISNDRTLVANLTFRNCYTTIYTIGHSVGVWLYAGVVSNCVITSCNGISAGGLTQFGGVFTDSVISNNICSTHTGPDRIGGGAYLFGGTLQRTLIAGNRNGRGGAVVLNGDNARMRDCTVRDNWSVLGGNVRIQKGIVERCLIAENGQGTTSTTEAGAETSGAGAYVTGTSSLFRNNVVIGNAVTNSTSTGAGGVYVLSGGQVVNCTVVNNDHYSGGPHDIANDGGVVANTIADVLTTTSGTSASNFVGGDPLFRNPAAGDFSLRSVSPCLNAGDNSYWSDVISPVDYLGNPRIKHGTVDIGAYEYNRAIGTILSVR